MGTLEGSPREPVSEEASRTDSLASRIARHFSGSVDPAISLHVDHEVETPREGELIARLASRSGSFGRYRIRGEIGRGGMGVVLRVWDEDLRRHLAMKLILQPGQSAKHSSAEDPRTISRFLEEAQITGQLDHPGIVPVHELGVDAEGRAYFTMKLVRGESLARILERVRDRVPPWTLPRVVGVLVKVCEAMAYAHDKGVAHRDLKPANVMVGRFGEVYVTDWGLARVLGRPASEETVLDVDASDPPSQFETVRSVSEEHTFHGEVLGTPAYMCPEQAAGRVREVSRAWDVYSLGAILYHLLAGEPPHEQKGARRGQREVLAAVLAGPPRELARIAPSAPAELVAVCRKAMSRRPADRYASADELGEDLRSWLEGRVVTAHSAGRWARTRKWVGRNRAWVAAILVALALTISGWTASSTLLAARNRSLERRQLESDDQLRARLEEEAHKLGPASPANLDTYEDWVARARAFAARIERDHGRELEHLRERRAGTEPRSTAIESEASPAGVLARFEQFAGTGGVIERIENALAIARSLEARTLEDPPVAERWREACASIANQCPVYGELILDPQWGLIPLFRDPVSGLWEFLHVASGAEPRWDEGRARFHMEEASGVVLVLIPGGHAILGSTPNVEINQNLADAAGRAAMTLEEMKSLSPVDEVELEPYFLSKYELTQAQSLRIAAGNPSSAPIGFFYGIGRVTPLHPVENVSRKDAVHVLELVGLTLPTEAQWEHAARGGVDSSWWTGPRSASLETAENLADFTLAVWNREVGAVEAWSDGFPIHAPIGSFRPNPYGLYDVLGNVEELCLDWLDGQGRYANVVGAPRATGTAERITRTRVACVARGGSFETLAATARASRGEVLPAASSLAHVGVRPARLLDPGSWRR